MNFNNSDITSLERGFANSVHFPWLRVEHINYVATVCNVRSVAACLCWSQVFFHHKSSVCNYSPSEVMLTWQIVGRTVSSQFALQPSGIDTATLTFDRHYMIKTASDEYLIVDLVTCPYGVFICRRWCRQRPCSFSSSSWESVFGSNSHCAAYNRSDNWCNRLMERDLSSTFLNLHNLDNIMV